MTTKRNTGGRGFQSWATPQWLFDALSDRFGPFTLDVCAEPWSAKCDRYYTKEQDGLLQCWANERVFCNPPFSMVEAWLEKGHYHALWSDTRSVFVLPANTDTAWFHEIAVLGQVWFIRGRVQFDPPPDQPATDSGNNTGTIVVLLDPAMLKSPSNQNFGVIDAKHWCPKGKRQAVSAQQPLFGR